MTRDPALVGIATSLAAEHKLDPALVCAVIEQESSWNCWAVRYEQGFFARYVRNEFLAGGFGATEAQTRAMSFGLMQVMGQVAREFGFTGECLTELCDPHVGVEFGCRVLEKRVAERNGVIAEALLAYNGGANTLYPGEVLARVPSYQT
jgi:soluble lytic murein transglycosylase-like protein